jgi:putative transposase
VGALDDINGIGAPTRDAPTLGDIVGAFKSITTNECIRGIKTLEWASFSGRLWQRNYYEHIIRNEKNLIAMRHYIRMNPSNWASDPENPFSGP